MRILAVGGCCSGVGKTALACRILGVLPGWGALKVSPAHGEVRHGLEAPYRIDTPGVDDREGDTGRFRAAGAARVAWLRTVRDSLEQALDEALGHFAELPGVLVEGNAAALAGSPDGVVLVARAGQREVKASASRLGSRADWVVWNHRAALDGTPRAVDISRLERTLGARIGYVVDAAEANDPGTAEFLDAIRAWARCRS